ncbi:PLDc N-terminal domain-containing protein [Gracilibacillus phocaeensis]|uniref:PLDc N-terminal domain-containing protein n=1 Tax=Gracilibacillus phocaeensis TaxID=2042304 RepID=UPI00103051C3|nr:PLDc N-terminal domain-containing protein [Gracilibacillus phocaeensis]
MNTDIRALFNVDWAAILPLVIPILVLHFLLLVVALIDLYRRRKLIHHPIIWLIIIVLLNTIGPIIYLVIGRRMLKNDRY